MTPVSYSGRNGTTYGPSNTAPSNALSLTSQHTIAGPGTSAANSDSFLTGTTLYYNGSNGGSGSFQIR